jgi:hypothetical protein
MVFSKLQEVYLVGDCCNAPYKILPQLAPSKKHYPLIGKTGAYYAPANLSTRTVFLAI